MLKSGTSWPSSVWDWVGRERLHGLLIAALAFLVYSNSIGSGFVWDDELVIVKNAALRQDALSMFSGVDVARQTDLTPYYRPLTLLTFLIEERLHGLTPWIMHFVNVLLHAAAAYVVHRLSRELFTSESAALLAGLLFAVHPINTEVVNFLSARGNILAAIFVLMTFLLHKKSIQ